MASMAITVSAASNLGYFYEISDNINNFTIFTCILIVGIVNLFFFAILVHGTAKNNSASVRAWLIFMYITLWLDAIFFIISICYLDFNSIIFSFSKLLLNIFFVSVVRSYHISLLEKQMQEKQNPSENSTKEY